MATHACEVVTAAVQPWNSRLAVTYGRAPTPTLWRCGTGRPCEVRHDACDGSLIQQVELVAGPGHIKGAVGRTAVYILPCGALMPPHTRTLCQQTSTEACNAGSVLVRSSQLHLDTHRCCCCTNTRGRAHGNSHSIKKLYDDEA